MKSCRRASPWRKRWERQAVYSEKARIFPILLIGPCSIRSVDLNPICQGAAMAGRRDFLKTMGALTSCAVFHKNPGSSANFATLQTINLIFHGPFAFIVDQSMSKVRVVTPTNQDHAFCWYGYSYAPMSTLPANNRFELDPAGLAVGNTPPDPDQTKSI